MNEQSIRASYRSRSVVLMCESGWIPQALPICCWFSVHRALPHISLRPTSFKNWEKSDGSEMARRRSTKINQVGKLNPKKIQTLDTYSYISLIVSSERRIWLFCLVFRVLNSLLIRTYFDPDEHWQSLEVAHRIAFGYGHLTWEWKKGIRSYLHPMVFVFLYKVLDFLRLDTPWFMIRAPRILQSIFSSVGDLYLYKLSHLIFDEHVARWTLFCQLTNWFMFFCIPRTYSNSMETVLTTVGLFYWFSSKNSPQSCVISSRKLGLLFAALSCAIRPTSAITWLYVGFISLLWMGDKLVFVLLEVIPIGILVSSLPCLLDRLMYGSWVIVPYNFFKFNFLSSGGNFYGTHKWHWYFTQGFSAMIFTFLPWSLHGIYKAKEWRFSGLIAWVLVIYSTFGHKEFRFVLPMLPLTLMFSGFSLATMSHRLSHDKPFYVHGNRHSKRILVVIFLVLTNLPMALYTSLFHQSGREAAMNYLASEAHEGKVRNVLFLMPCHSTPYYSTLHYNLPMRFLDCSPIDAKESIVESDQFKMDPVGFVSIMVANWSLPSHVVVFDLEERKIRDLLHSHFFIEVKRFFNAHFPVGEDLREFVSLYASLKQ